MVLDWLFPPACEGCGERLGVGRTDPICAPCGRDRWRIGGAVCSRCGYPFAADATTGAGDAGLCGACLRRPPPFLWHRSGLYHEGLAGALIAALKYRRRRDLATRLAAWAWGEWPRPPAADVLLSVPLGAGRLRERGFNQAVLLARWASRRWAVPLVTDGVERLPGPPQVGLSRSARLANAQGRFRVISPDRIAGRRVVLVDDVYTTGATLAALSRALQRAGAEEVRAITLARRM
ncbi:MAG TPA: ComF family protein [bacterium]